MRLEKASNAKAGKMLPARRKYKVFAVANQCQQRHCQKKKKKSSPFVSFLFFLLKMY